MTDFIEITFTTDSIEEARKIALFLVEERLVACAQIIPNIESIYLWKEKIETSQESKILLKTHKEKQKTVEQSIRELHSYDVPEILVFPIENGNPQYLEWMNEVMTTKRKG